MPWQKSPPQLVHLFDEMLQALPGVERRQMFGYPVAYANGVWFAGLHQDSLVIRLAEVDRAAFLNIEGARPFEPMPVRPMREFVAAPPAMLESRETLMLWLRKALDWAVTQPPKPPRSRKAGRSG